MIVVDRRYRIEAIWNGVSHELFRQKAAFAAQSSGFVAHEYDYGSGNGIGQVVKRLEQRATEDKRLKQLLARVVAALKRESV